MQILYATALFPSLEPLLFHGKKNGEGLPSQLLVLEELIRRGHELTLLVESGSYSYADLDIRVKWLSACDIVLVNRYDSAISKCLFFGKIRKAASQLLSQKRFNFVYLHGGEVACVASVASKFGIPCGQRAYGTPMFRWMNERSMAWIALRHYPQLQIFSLPKQFLLVTDDGCRANEVVSRMWGDSPPYRLIMKINGVNYPSTEEIKKYDFSNQKYFVCVARIYEDKGQLEAIKIFNALLKSQQIDSDIKFYLVGSIDSVEYYNILQQFITDNLLRDKVIFKGPIENSQIQALHHYSVASFFMSPIANRGNSFLEAMAAESLVITTEEDESLSSIGVDGNCAIRVGKDIDNAVETILRIINNKELAKHIRQNARRYISTVIPSWESRVNFEVDLVESNSSISGGTNDCRHY